MSSQVLTRVQLENLFFTATRDITNYPEEKIRIAYASEGQPAWGINEDVIFVAINPIDDAYDKKRDYIEDTTNDEFAQVKVFYHRVIQVMWMVYGPNSYDVADLIRHGILTEAIRRPLAWQKVVPLPEIPAPARVPYSFQGQWWERSDVRVQFNVGTLRVTDVPYIESADIEIHDDHGLQRVVEVRKPEE